MQVQTTLSPAEVNEQSTSYALIFICLIAIGATLSIVLSHVL